MNLSSTWLMLYEEGLGPPSMTSARVAWEMRMEGCCAVLQRQKSLHIAHSTDYCLLQQQLLTQESVFPSSSQEEGLKTPDPSPPQPQLGEKAPRSIFSDLSLCIIYSFLFTVETKLQLALSVSFDLSIPRHFNLCEFPAWWTRGGQTEERPHPEDVLEEGLL